MQRSIPLWRIMCATPEQKELTILADSFLFVPMFTSNFCAIQPCLPKNLGTKPNGAIECGNGWLAQSLGAIRGSDRMPCGRTLSSGYMGERLS